MVNDGLICTKLIQIKPRRAKALVVAFQSGTQDIAKGRAGVC
jgi:hypothetical protein